MYSVQGVIQSSGREFKTNIKKVLSSSLGQSATGVEGPSIGQGALSSDTSDITIGSLVSCIKSSNLYTFTYLDKEGVSRQDSSATQLGLIADEIKENFPEVFKYIGASSIVETPDPSKYERISDKNSPNYFKYHSLDGSDEYLSYYQVPSEECIKEERLGLQPLPVAVMALSACKYLIEKVENLEFQLSK